MYWLRAYYSIFGQVCQVLRKVRHHTSVGKKYEVIGTGRSHTDTHIGKNKNGYNQLGVANVDLCDLLLLTSYF